MPQDAWREVDVYRFRDCCQTSRNTCTRQCQQSRELSCSRIAWTRLRRGAGAARRKKNSSRGVVSRQDARGWIADGERLCKCAQETSPPRARNVARGRCQGTGRRGVMGSFSGNCNWRATSIPCSPEPPLRTGSLGELRNVRGRRSARQHPCFRWTIASAWAILSGREDRVSPAWA